MFDAIGKATLITYFPPPLILATVFIFFIGYFYGYAVSFIFGIRKTITVGFFVVVLATILIFLSSAGFMLTISCSALEGSPLCNDSIHIVSRVSVILLVLLSHLFVNLSVGHVGILLGALFYFPSEWFLKRFTRFSSIKKSVDELENITQNSKAITTGTFNLSNKEGN